jgi:uncharacterized repeat protein (TIGR03803 family)
MKNHSRSHSTKVGLFAAALAIALFAPTTPATAVADTYRVLYNFDGKFGIGGPNGGPPVATPVLDVHGNLFGPAGGGIGTSQLCSGPCGVVYEMTRDARDSWTESVAVNISSFFDTGALGGPVAFDAHGNLYGSIGVSSIPGDNWIFQLTPNPPGWGFGLIYHGYATSSSGVIADEKGNLYGELGVPSNYTTTIGELSPEAGGWQYTDLYTFCPGSSCFDGAYPRAQFTWDSAGNLYGTDYAGGYSCPGTNGCGAAFEMRRAGKGTWRYHVLHRFGAFKTDGLYPWSGLLLDSSGSAYGTTIYGGPRAQGEIFKLTPTATGEWKETLLYGFPDLKIGAFPWGDLAFDKSGNLYGVANGGNVCGAYYCGEVYELSPQRNGQWKYRVLHSFQGPDGAYPYGVVIDQRGHLFGTAWGGGTHNFGVVFEITP